MADGLSPVSPIMQLSHLFYYVVAEAVDIEPVSASKFPVIGEKQGIYAIG
jgi:hypothetical protein